MMRYLWIVEIKRSHVRGDWWPIFEQTPSSTQRQAMEQATTFAENYGYRTGKDPQLRIRKYVKERIRRP